MLSFVFHGLYDYILLSENLPSALVLPLILGLWVWLVRAVPQLREGIRIAEQKGTV
jgi:hypothetical protein